MTVGLVIVSHSARLAAGVVELASQMVQGKVPIAPAGGGIDGVLGTAADMIAAAITSVANPDGTLVLLDLGSAILSTEMALEMLDEEQRRRVRLSFAPLVEGAVAAAVEAAAGSSLDAVQQAAENAASPDQLQQLKPFSQETAGTSPPSPPEQPVRAGSLSGGEVIISSPPTPETAPDTLEAQLLLTNSMGLHARPASLFVQTAARFQATIQVSVRGKQANAKRMIGVLSLGARQGDTITIQASGADAAAAIAALTELAQAGFYETETAASPTVSEATPKPSDKETPPAGVPRPLVAQSGTASESETWHGIYASAGAAVAPAFLYASTVGALDTIERRTISTGQVADEQARLRTALESAVQELQTLEQEMQGKVGKAEAAIFEAQSLMLRDDELIGLAANTIAEQHIDAASALAAAGKHYADTLAALDNPVLAARAADVRDVISRAIGFLDKSGTYERPASKPDLSALQQPVILLAHDLTPSDTAALSPDTVVGICTVQGGPTAHAAILARALGIPALAGLPEEALQRIKPGDELGLDADNGLLYRLPAPETRAQLALRQAERQQQRAALAQAAASSSAPVMIDGQRIYLLANIGNAAEAAAARQWGAEGVGLLRTEFLFAGASTMPGEEEQRQQYTQVFRAFIGNTPGQAMPVVVRTLDAGADKPMPALNAVIGPFSEANPALGLRGIRLHLAHPELLEQQISALLLASVDTGIELHIMFPMISTIEELRAARAIFDRVYQRLHNQQIPLPEHVPVGIMVEVPSAAIMASELAALADFFSIGANDLLQYTVASDRTNASVASLYHPMQPSALRLIGQVAQAGQRASKPVAVCGEIGGDARLAPVLVGLGVTELSMNPASIPAIRAALTGKSAQELSNLAARVTQAQTIAEAEQILS